MSKGDHVASRLKNLYLKITDLNLSNYKNKGIHVQEFIFFVRLKTDYFSKLDIVKIDDTKNFWKTIKPFFLTKI